MCDCIVWPAGSTITGHNVRNTDDLKGKTAVVGGYSEIYLMDDVCFESGKWGLSVAKFFSS